MIRFFVLKKAITHKGLSDNVSFNKRLLRLGSRAACSKGLIKNP